MSKVKWHTKLLRANRHERLETDLSMFLDECNKADDIEIQSVSISEYKHVTDDTKTVVALVIYTKGRQIAGIRI